VSAWQHPTDSCPACGQDILLRPEVTYDIRMVYVRYCPRCDAGEPVVAPREHAASSWSIDADTFWTPAPAGSRSAGLQGSETASNGVAATSAAAATPANGRFDRRQSGLELWWNGAGDDAAGVDGARSADDPDRARTRMDERWAAFAANDTFDDDRDDDEMPMAAEGSFSFGTEDIGRHRRVRFARPRRLRQSA